MTKKEAMRIAHQENVLMQLGFTQQEAAHLRRISMTLQRWHERECNGEVQRGDDGVARGYRTNARFLDPNDPRYWYRVADRETGAIKRLASIIKARNIRMPKMEDPLMNYYIQGDPRGAALYIIRPGDVPEGKDANAYYSRGICVY